MGGWTAAELAVMNPKAVDRLVLVAAAGLKPEQGEILDIFYYPVDQLTKMVYHDPAQVPEWDELFGTPPTPEQADLALRNREMSARLTWKPYMHNPRLPLLPAARHEPDAGRLGARGPDRPGDLRRAVRAAAAERDAAGVSRGAATRRCIEKLDEFVATAAGLPEPVRGDERGGGAVDEAVLVLRDAAPRLRRGRGSQVPGDAAGDAEHLLRSRRRGHATTTTTSTSTSWPTRSASTG